LTGKLGKSTLADWLVKQRDALIIKVTAEMDAKDLIRRKKDEDGLFETHPIIIVDLPLAASATAQTSKPYEVLESILGTFHSTRRDGAVVTWARGQKPHVIVFSNESPDPHRVSGDRFEVFLVTKTHELVKATHVHNEIDAFVARTNALQQQEEAAAISGEQPPRLEMRNRRGGAGGSSASGGGAGGSGALSPETKALVVEDLTRLLEPKEESIVTLRTMAPSLTHKLSDASLLLLGANSVAQVRNINNRSAKWLPSFLANLKTCLVEGDDCAFPGFEIMENTTGKSMGGHPAFMGEYLNAVGYIQ
jgi:hypothetical protein